MVYLAYQLVDSITFKQVLIETLLLGVDIEQKQKEIIADLRDDKISDATSNRMGKITKQVNYYLMVEQEELLYQVLRVLGRDKIRVNQAFKVHELVGGRTTKIWKKSEVTEKPELTVAKRECLCAKQRNSSTL